MGDVTIRLSGTPMAQFAEQLDNAGNRATAEMARGLNDGGRLVTTQVRRALKMQTGVLAPQVIKDATPVMQATSGHLVFKITASGKGLPIRDFAVSASPGSPVTAEVWGVAHTFQRSFMTSARGLLRARVGPGREPIRSLRGPSVPKELVKDLSLESFERAVPLLVVPAVMSRLSRLLP